VSVQIKILSEKIAVEASRGAKWRPPLLIFHRVVFFFPAMSNFSTQAPVVDQYVFDCYKNTTNTSLKSVEMLNEDVYLLVKSKHSLYSDLKKNR
jgi:competence transcription factor ComK